MTDVRSTPLDPELDFGSGLRALREAAAVVAQASAPSPAPTPAPTPAPLPPPTDCGAARTVTLVPHGGTELRIGEWPVAHHA